MAYSDILKMKKVQEKHEEKVFVKNLIVGSDIFAIDLYKYFNDNESNSAKILAPDIVTDENLELLGPSLVRGEANINVLKSLGVEGEQSHSIFYKDMRFHKFGARTKPMKLLWGEEKFTQDHMKVKVSELLPSLETEGLIEKVKQSALQLTVKGIERTTPKELIDQAFWRVHCTNGTVVECENLYWGETPASFYEYYNNKSELTSNFVSFCESTKTPCALFVHMDLKEKITDQKETYFFPLSFTHDWGHFMGEIVDKAQTDEGQEARFVTFVNKEENSEEDISRKIRLLKKNFEKNFKKFSNTDSKEFVVLKENAYCPKIDDFLLESEEDIQDKLSFFSFNAPLTNKLKAKDNFEDSWFETSLVVRALLAQGAIKSI